MKRPVIGCSTYRKISKDTNVPLYGLMTSYVKAIEAAGGIPLLIPLSIDNEGLEILLERLDGLVLPGGGDIDPKYYQGAWHPQLRDIDADRDRVEIFLARKAVEVDKPLLAICRGHQVLNVALGGTMYEDIASQMPTAIKHDYFMEGPRTYLPHAVAIQSDSRLAHILGGTTVKVNSLHHQGVRDLAPGLVATAVAPDGLVEGVELPDHAFAVGVQWHPENLVDNDPAMLALFRAHAAAASQNGKS